MKRYKPYNIIHINLAELTTVPDLHTVGQGNYVVFWWNQIALGDMYVKPGKALTEKEYYNDLIESINTSVVYYSTKNNIVETGWQQWLQDKHFVKWSAWMEKIFPAPDDVPESVEVSVIICTRNRAEHLHKCLTALKKLSCIPKEIVVVDNAPLDGASEAIVKQFDKVVYVAEHRPGLDIARNTGVVNASMPIVAFIDDDVVIHPHLFYNVWKTFQNANVAAMTGLVIAAELNTEAQYLFEKCWSFNRGYIDEFYDYNFFQKTLKKGPPVWRIGAGANMAFRKDIFEKVGYFDERLDAGAAGCNGDSEMWYRVLAAGNTIQYNPRAINFHEHRKDMAGLKNQLFNYMRGFAAAAMIQQSQEPKAGYKKLLKRLPKQYAKYFIKGFPNYQLRYRHLWAEAKGYISGYIYYQKNKNSPVKP